MFFLLWPLFARAPRHWFLEIFLLSAPGVQSVFFCCAPLCAATFRRGQSKIKNTTQGVFFFAPAPGKGRGRRSPVPTRGQSKKKTPPRVCSFLLRPRRKAREGEAPLGAGTGPEQKKKKHHPGCFHFFCSGPGERQGKEKPRADTGPEQKKNTTQGVFFCCAPAKGKGRRSPVGRRHGARAKKKNTTQGVFFLLWPRAGAQRGFSFPCLSPGPQQKKKTPCFALAPCRHGASPSLPFPGAGAKKTPWVVFFVCCGPARTLTHSLRAWVAMPPPRRGGVFFLLRPRPDRGGVFFLLWPRPDAHSLTVGWGDFGKARVVFFFFCCGPAGSF